MSKLIVVGIGGTGARCAEAVAYLAAAGMFSLNEGIQVLLIDRDRDNQNLTIATQQLGSAARLSGILRDRSGAFPFFGSVRSVLGDKGQDEDFRFFPTDNEQNPTLSRSLNLGAESGLPEILRLLIGQSRVDDRPVDGLEDLEDELKMNLEKGYRQRAHLGALELHSKLRGDDLLEPLRKASRVEKAPVLVFGSIFGGMGAAGIPALAALLAGTGGPDDRGALGVCALGSYFSFPSERDAWSDADEGFLPDPATFPVASRLALEYYAVARLAGYECLYFLGAPAPARTAEKPASGGVDQYNRPHYHEVAAALAAYDFSVHHKDRKGLLTCAAEACDWNGLPVEAKDAAVLRHRLSALVLGSAYFSLCIHPILYQSRRFDLSGLSGYPWALELLGRGRNDDAASQRVISDFTRFASRLLQWATTMEFVPNTKGFLFGRQTPAPAATTRASVNQWLDGLLGVTSGGISRHFDEVTDALGHISIPDYQNTGGELVAMILNAAHKSLEPRFPGSGGGGLR